MWQLVWQVCRAACFEEIPHCPCVVSALLMRLLLMCFSAVSSNKIRRVCAASWTCMEVLQQTVCKKPDIQGPQEGSSNHTPSAEPLITLWFLWLSSGPLASNHLLTTSLLNGYVFPCTNGWHGETAGSTSSAFSTQVPLEQLRLEGIFEACFPSCSCNCDPWY